MGPSVEGSRPPEVGGSRGPDLELLARSFVFYGWGKQGTNATGGYA